MRPYRLLVACGLAALALRADAQPGDSLRLEPLLAAVEAQDPRQREVALQAALTGLRLADLRAERRPRLAFGAEATYQNEVPEFDLPLPGAEPPTTPRLRAQATLDAEQLLFDGGLVGARERLEEARLAEARAGVAVTLYPLRLATAEAFFAARLMEDRIALLDLQARDLEARRELVASQSRHGAALAADVAAVEAELLLLGLQRDELAADRRAALAVLTDLTGRPIPEGTPLALADLRAEAEAALLLLDEEPDTVATARPEFALYDRRQERLAAEAEVAGRQTRPRVAAFGQAGVGRPGFAQFEERIHPFGLVGLRVRWSPVDWGASQRAQEAARLQQDIAGAQRAAFARQLRRDVEDERAAIARLERALEVDEAVIARREEVERVARRQLEEGVLLVADYVPRLTDLHEARQARAIHRVQIQQARARLLLTLGSR